LAQQKPNIAFKASAKLYRTTKRNSTINEFNVVQQMAQTSHSVNDYQH